MFLKLYLIALTSFLAIDFLWLGFVAKNVYAKYIGNLLRPDVNWTAAIIFYLAFIVGLVIFVIDPAIEQKNLNYALVYGALFGFITYATYDLTNLATLKGWSLQITLIDLAWGAIVSALVSVITYLIATKI